MAQDDPEMKSPFHATSIFPFPACPLLPEVTHPHGHMVTRAHAGQKGERYYLATLCYAQSLWREGKPAQAILQLNKGFMADLLGDEKVLAKWPPPYAVLVWFLKNAPADRFMGNPVRHFQHLATRVSGPRKEIRAWRAWACFHLARRVLEEGEFPVDQEQVEREGVVFPEWERVVREIRDAGWMGEGDCLVSAS